MSQIKVILVDYKNKAHASDLSFLLDEYAKDPMGGTEPLSVRVKQTVVTELSRLSYAFSIICYVDGMPAGLSNCFDSFSTFACKPIINIHDFVVLKEFRGKNLSQKMLQKIEDIAISKGCCKITLEVLSGNEIAKKTYKKFGFCDYELNSETGSAVFWQKQITS